MCRRNEVVKLKKKKVFILEEEEMSHSSIKNKSNYSKLIIILSLIVQILLFLCFPMS